MTNNPMMCNVTRVSKVADKTAIGVSGRECASSSVRNAGLSYAAIELAAPAGLRQKFCLHCGHSFPDPEGAAAFQYTLLKRPSQDTLEDL